MTSAESGRTVAMGSQTTSVKLLDLPTLSEAELLRVQKMNLETTNGEMYIISVDHIHQKTGGYLTLYGSSNYTVDLGNQWSTVRAPDGHSRTLKTGLQDS